MSKKKGILSFGKIELWSATYKILSKWSVMVKKSWEALCYTNILYYPGKGCISAKIRLQDFCVHDGSCTVCEMSRIYARLCVPKKPLQTHLGRFIRGALGARTVRPGVVKVSCTAI